MKVIVALTILVVTGCVLADSNEIPRSNGKLARILREYKTDLSYLVEQIASGMCRNVHTYLRAPIEEVIKRAGEIDTESQTVCSLFRNRLVYVMDPLVKAIDRCPRNKEAEVAQYAVEAATEVSRYICQLNGDHIFELANLCIPDIDVGEDNCLKNIESIWSDSTTIKGRSFKVAACSEYRNIRPCIQRAINRNCKLQITRGTLIGLLDSAFKTPCA